MPKRKAKWWPSSILSDPDVLSVDDEGRFVLCKICHVHYAVHGGKKPKPVIMNSNFRTRAWDVHKERTNSHRMQKQQERLQQTKSQQPAQGQQPTDTSAQQQTQQQQQQQQPVQSEQDQQRLPMQAQQLQTTQGQQQMQASPRQTQATEQMQDRAMAALASQAQPPPRQVPGQGQPPAPLTPQQVQQSKAQTLQQRRLQQHEPEETKEPAVEHLHEAARNSSIERTVSTASPISSTVLVMSRSTSLQGTGEVINIVGKRPATAASACAPVSARRRVFRAGSPGSSMQLLAESEAARRQNAHAYERHSFMAAGAVSHARRAGSSERVVAMEQADSSARWRHMHDDVSRALNSAPRRRPQGPASYTTGELRAAKTLAQTETGDLGSNNSERVAKKLQLLNAEYQASNMRHADAYNMRHTEMLDRRSASYKEYWGTLRNVYTSSGASGSSGNVASFRKSHHRSSALTKLAQQESKETEVDSTTPDDSGSSEDAFKPVVVVHDASLVNAIERLTDATSKQIANLYQREAAGTREALAGLTSVMTDMRVQHGNAFERIIALQEKQVKLMEGILEVKLRKEAARNAMNNGSSSGSTSGGSSGCTPGSSTTESDGATN
ncbi:unnamed protein product [Phytophthora fragariaefolia]|uniref:Unnamed protein product n=1 Tax=Phytophthora fragariaefolia TaxID=1490495 RepID=A0A9W7CVQ6_9STRA|nr:unnamed protein product [Phytophthora fragariaefolia]